MKISMIAAIGQNNELGRNNQLLWNMPSDMKHFRDTTRNHAIIMGRKTYESLGKALPSRQNIVITGDRSLVLTDAVVVHSLSEALEKVDAKTYGNEVFIIGGAQIYTQGIDIADTLYITHIDGTFSADTFFPEINPLVWKKDTEELYDKDNLHNYNYTFTTYTKIQ